jgi:hypothetical protein
VKTPVEGLLLVDFHVTDDADVDGFKGVGALLRDPAFDCHAVFFWVPDAAVGYVMPLLVAAGIEYELRDESTDIAVPTKTGSERLQLTREFIRPKAIGDWIPVVKRHELGKQQTKKELLRAIPARLK